MLLEHFADILQVKISFVGSFQNPLPETSARADFNYTTYDKDLYDRRSDQDGGKVLQLGEQGPNTTYPFFSSPQAALSSLLLRFQKDDW